MGLTSSVGRLRRDAIREPLVSRRLDELETYLRHEDDLDPAWRHAAWMGEDAGYLSPDELIEATERIKAVIAEYTDPGRPRGATARRVSFFSYAVPSPDEPA